MPGTTRRSFLAGAMASTIAGLVGCQAGLVTPVEHTRVYRIGMLVLGNQASRTIGNLSPTSTTRIVVNRLYELGYVDGQRATYEIRASLDVNQLPDLASDLVKWQPDVIIVGNSATVGPAMRATSSIPIVFYNVASPVEQGFVASLARPGGNVTGVTSQSADISSKRVEVFKAAVPGISRVAVVWSSTNGGSALAFRESAAALDRLGLTTLSVDLAQLGQIRTALNRAIDDGADSVLELITVPLTGGEDLVTFLAMIEERGLPLMSFSDSRLSRSACLMVYAPDQVAQLRRSGDYVDLILKGAKPSELPVEQASKFEFGINLKRAEALGISIPEHVLLEATQILR